MERYASLAVLYDSLSAEYDYDRWVESVQELYKRFSSGMQASRVLDLGCGTGRASAVFAGKGCEVVGVDASPDMLTIAEARLGGMHPAPLLLCQDLRELDLASFRFDLVVSLCDTLNYITDLNELATTFRNVANCLSPGGVFVFDLSTEHKLTTVYGNNTYVDEGSGYFIAWENDWCPRKRLCTMHLNIFLPDQNGSWRRATEVHEQRAHNHAEITEALRLCGFKGIIGPLAAFDLSEATDQTERVFYAAQVGE